MKGLMIRCACGAPLRFLGKLAAVPAGGITDCQRCDPKK